MKPKNRKQASGQKPAGQIARPQRPELTPYDWNFDAVPKPELEACCFWEYARESAFIRDVQRRCADPKAKAMFAEERFQEWFAFVGHDLELIDTKSIRYTSHIFRSGWGCEKWHPAVATNSFPKPWRCLSDAEKKERARKAIDFYNYPTLWTSTKSDPKPVERDRSRQAAMSLIEGFARDFGAFLAEKCPAAQERPEDEKAAIAKISKPSHWKGPWAEKDKLAHAALMKRWIPPDPSLDLHKLRELSRRGFLADFSPASSVVLRQGAESFIMTIEWTSFTDDQIAEALRKWVKPNRPNNIPMPSGRGQPPWRAMLTRLAAMRLLHHYKANEILGVSK